VAPKFLVIRRTSYIERDPQGVGLRSIIGRRSHTDAPCDESQLRRPPLSRWSS